MELGMLSRLYRQHVDAHVHRDEMRSILSLCRWSLDPYSFSGWRDRLCREKIGESLEQSHCFFTLGLFFREFHAAKPASPITSCEFGEVIHAWNASIPKPRRKILILCSKPMRDSRRTFELSGANLKNGVA